MTNTAADRSLLLRQYVVTFGVYVETYYRRFGEIMTLSLRHVSAGTLSIAAVMATAPTSTVITICVKGYGITIDVIMGTIASQIISLTIVYSIVYSDAGRRKHQRPRHWPLCGEFTGDRWIPRTNGQLRGKCFHLMTSSWICWISLQQAILLANIICQDIGVPWK